MPFQTASGNSAFWRDMRPLPAFTLPTSDKAQESSKSDQKLESTSQGECCLSETVFVSSQPETSMGSQPLSVRQGLLALPDQVRDIFVAASHCSHPLALEKSESFFLKIPHQKVANHRGADDAGTRPRQTIAPQMRAQESSGVSCALTPSELAALSRLSHLRLAYAALLAARMPARQWAIKVDGTNPAACFLANFLFLAYQMTSDGSLFENERRARLWQMAIGVTKYNLPDEQRFSGAYSSAWSQKKLCAMQYFYERQLLTFFHYDLMVAPELIEAAAAELQSMPQKPLPRCETRFARRLFLEAGAEIYCSVNQIFFRDKLPKALDTAYRSFVPYKEFQSFPSLDILLFKLLKGKRAAKQLQSVTFASAQSAANGDAESASCEQSSL